MIAGSAAAEAMHLLASNNVIHISSKLAVTWWQAIAAFVVDAVVLVVFSLFYEAQAGRGVSAGSCGALKRREQKSDAVTGDDAWYRSPGLLAGGALVLIVALNIIFI